MKLSLLALFILTIQGCGKQCDCRVDAPCEWCEKSNPVEELAWLNDLVGLYCDAQAGSLDVYVCMMNDGTPAFLIDFGSACSDCYRYLRDCQGRLIGKSGGVEGTMEGNFDVDWNSMKLIYSK